MVDGEGCAIDVTLCDNALRCLPIHRLLSIPRNLLKNTRYCAHLANFFPPFIVQRSIWRWRGRRACHYRSHRTALRIDVETSTKVFFKKIFLLFWCWIFGFLAMVLLLCVGFHHLTILLLYVVIVIRSSSIVFFKTKRMIFFKGTRLQSISCSTINNVKKDRDFHFKYDLFLNIV